MSSYYCSPQFQRDSRYCSGRFEVLSYEVDNEPYNVVVVYPASVHTGGGFERVTIVSDYGINAMEFDPLGSSKETRF